MKKVVKNTIKWIKKDKKINWTHLQMSYLPFLFAAILFNSEFWISLLFGAFLTNAVLLALLSVLFNFKLGSEA